MRPRGLSPSAVASEYQEGGWEIVREEATTATRPPGAQEGHDCGLREEISLGLVSYSEALYGSDVSVESVTIGGNLERR